MNKPQILVIEDDKAIRNLISITLEMQNYDFLLAENGTNGIMLALSNSPSVIILDLGLPDMDGTDIIRKIRSFSEIPIIVVSARFDDRDKIEALDLGADDYLTKPFSTDELLARVRVALRRVANSSVSTQAEASTFVNGSLRIDFSSREVFVLDNEIHLTPIEYNLLCLLSKNVGRVLTHNLIIKEVWGSSYSQDTQSLRVFMATLRKKIEGASSGVKYIQTHVGVGYRMISLR
ncbi:MAG: response regulator [Clostridium sp.]